MPRKPTQSVGRPGAKSLGIGDQREIGLEVGGLRGDVLCDGLASHFFFALEENAHIEGQRAVGGQQRLECLDLGTTWPLSSTAPRA
jgi:hypothetical protein